MMQTLKDHEVTWEGPESLDDEIRSSAVPCVYDFLPVVYNLCFIKFWSPLSHNQCHDSFKLCR
jgi:hypothetical protein